MGLDTTHNAFHGAYSSFSRFRSHLEAFHEEYDYTFSPSNDAIAKGVHLIIYHSDCDGGYTPSECGIIAESLTALIPEMNNESELYERAVQFRDGCKLAHSLNEYLEFR